MPRRVLFIGEGSTLAHAGRPIALAAALAGEGWEAFVACPERYRRWLPPLVRWLPLKTQPPELFAAKLTAGRPLFGHDLLTGYMADDLALIAESRPDVVVGDLRLSLPASARKAGAPYIALSNAYWSPDQPLRPIRPQLDIFRGVPRPLAEGAFALLAGVGMRLSVRPIARFLAANGVDVGEDPRRVFTEADATLYADIPSLFPEVEPTERRRFLGPVAWEPPVDLPAWWPDLPDDRPTAYLSLGSSGDAGLLARLCAWLEGLDFTVLVATAGRAALEGSDDRFVADYLPGGQACAKADIVVCNGGSPMASQALLAGKPVLGVCSNMDQFLNMRAVRAQGAGRIIRADSPRRDTFERAVDRLLMPRPGRAAEALGAEGRAMNPPAILRQTIDRLAAGRR